MTPPSNSAGGGVPTDYTAHMPSPYQPLADYLTALPPETARVTLTFVELRHVLGRPLPASAWGRSWWATRAGATAARAWPAPGWRVSAVSVSGGREAATFVRAEAASWGRDA